MAMGLVIESHVLKGKPWIVSVRYAQVPFDRHANLIFETILLRREQDSLRIEIGDYIDNQTNMAFWTPARNMRYALHEYAGSGLTPRVDFDIPIPKVFLPANQLPDS